MKKYVMGVDFGTLSARALLVDVRTGEELPTAEAPYAHGVMDGSEYGHGWALQHPQDYLDALSNACHDVLRLNDISANNVVGFGLDFTSCTALPVLKNGQPLCFADGYEDRPHAMVKLWKHHAAQPQANRITQRAQELGLPWLADYGGRISSECLQPKLLQLLEEDPQVYDLMDYFMEAGDWLVWQLTGRLSRSQAMAGFRALWHPQRGYPAGGFWEALHPRLATIQQKLDGVMLPLDSVAGLLREQGAQMTGLCAGTPVAVPNIDAHISAAALGAAPGRMVIVMGTSACHLLVGEQHAQIPGTCAVVQGGYIPGYYAYESGQCCVGDHFDWFVQNALPSAYERAAEQASQSPHVYLSTLVEGLKPAQSGLIALDWWNGNRSTLIDGDLTGLILGLTLQTLPEHIYRALIEATAYGTRAIIDNYRAHGIPVKELHVTGGIARKNPVIMQIYADVINLPMHVAGTTQGSALGAALLASVSAREYPTVQSAMDVFVKPVEHTYFPVRGHVPIYDKLYREYLTLQAYFAQGGNDIMKCLKNLSSSI